MWHFDGCIGDLRPLSGVVSLFDMLAFAAEDFWETSHLLAQLKRYGQQDFDQADPAHIGMIIGKCRKHCVNLGLLVSLEHIDKMQEEPHLRNPDRFKFWMECISTTVHSELSHRQFFSLEPGVSPYIDTSWLMDTQLPDRFPSAFRELQSAGRCYAFGESTASAFHSMRALEVCLRVIGSEFPTIDMTRMNLNWGTLLDDIQSAIKQIGVYPPGRKKTDKDRDDEGFYSSVALHFLFLKNGWRNHVMHSRDNYSETDALQMLNHVKDLMLSLSLRLSEPVPVASFVITQTA